MIRRRRTRSIAVIVAVVVAVAVFAEGASANTWTTTSVFANGHQESLKANAHAMGVSILAGTVAGAPFSITSTGLETVGAKITQAGTIAELSGQLMLTGLTLSEPPGCTPPTSITTAALVGEVVQTGGNTYLRLTPASGTTVANFILGGSCALTGTPIKVSTSTYFCARMYPVGIMAVAQLIEMDSTVLSGCGGTLLAAGKPAELVAEGTLEVASGASWGVQ